MPGGSSSVFPVFSGILEGCIVVDIKRIKADCGDFRKASRWAEVRSDFDSTKFDAFRIVGIGVKFCRVMTGGGVVINVDPKDIRRVW
jgi:hypothetical protein